MGLAENKKLLKSILSGMETGSSSRGVIDSGLDDVQPIPAAVQTSWGAGTWRECCEVEDLLPVVDVSQDDKQLVLDAIRNACQEWGSFQVVGHGIPQQLMQEMIKICHGFFELPSSERSKYYSESIHQPFRWATGQNYATNKMPLWVDYIYMLCKPFPKPDEFPSETFREVSENYCIQVEGLAAKLSGLVSEVLGVDASVLAKKSTSQQVLRLNYYPSCPNPEAVIGASPHTDVNAFTILHQQLDVNGYEALHHGRWVGVKPMEGAFLFQAGDQLEILSNGRFKSAIHRATVNSKQARVSVASFFAPMEDECIAPLCTDDEAPAFVGTTYSEYFKTYFDLAFTADTALDKFKVAL